MNNNTVPAYEKIYNERAETAINTEVALPEYCPSIERIILTDTKSNINECIFENDKIKITGDCYFTVLYKSDYKEKIKSVTFTEQFSKELDASALLNYSEKDIHLNVKEKLTTPKATAINGRRLSLSANVIINVCADICVEVGLFKNEIINCETLDKQITSLSATFVPDIDFTLNHEISLSSEMPSASDIIFTTCLASVENIQKYDEKTIVSGNLNLYCLYEAENSEYENGEYISLQKQIPFTKEINSDGIKLPYEVELETSVVNSKCEISPDSYGENKMINAEISLCIKDIKILKNNTYTIFEDAFSCLFESEIQKSDYTAESIAECISAVCISEEQINNERSGISDIMLSSGNVAITNSEIVDGKLILSAKASATVIGTNDKGEMVSSTVSFPTHLTLTAPKERENISFYPVAEVSEITCRANDSVLNCSMKIFVRCVALKQTPYSAVSDFKICENSPREDKNTCVTIYYPESHESLWSIAKKYGVSTESIKLSNPKDNSKILLIPCE